MRVGSLDEDGNTGPSVLRLRHEGNGMTVKFVSVQGLRGKILFAAGLIGGSGRLRFFSVKDAVVIFSGIHKPEPVPVVKNRHYFIPAIASPIFRA